MAEFPRSIDGFDSTLTNVFKENDRKIQIDILEKFWLSKFIEKDLRQRRNIVRDIESNLKIEEVANKYEISRKHLNALFLKHLGKSPGEYQKIHRFRKAIAKRSGIKNLTELAYENDFYDQSHLIKDFKSLTNLNPKKFFRNVDTEQKNIWLFI